MGLGGEAQYWPPHNNYYLLDFLEDFLSSSSSELSDVSLVDFFDVALRVDDELLRSIFISSLFGFDRAVLFSIFFSGINLSNLGQATDPVLSQYF